VVAAHAPPQPPVSHPGRTPPHPHRRLVWFAIGAAVCLGLAWPLTDALLHGRWLPPPAPIGVESPLERLWTGLVPVAGGLWVFVLAATIGSFFNVVVHRLPAGRSVVFGRSACPACGGMVQARDNIPILGWLLLGGRCRWCGTEIAARYPIVEAVCAGALLMLWCAELLSGGVTLPVRPPNRDVGLVWIVLEPQWDLIGLFLYHAALLCMLLVWTLIAVDRRPIPVRHAVTALCLMTAAAMLVPGLHPVPVRLPAGAVAWPPPAEAWLSRGLFVSLAGAAAGCVVAAVVAALDPWSRRRHDTLVATETPRGRQPAAGLTWGLVLVGVTLGWQAVVATALIAALIAALIHGAARLSARVWSSAPPVSALPPEVCLLTATLLHLLAWRWIVVAWWP